MAGSPGAGTLGSLFALARESSHRQNERDIAVMMVICHTSVCRKCMRHPDDWARWCKHGRRMFADIDGPVTAGAQVVTRVEQ